MPHEHENEQDGIKMVYNMQRKVNNNNKINLKLLGNSTYETSDDSETELNEYKSKIINDKYKVANNIDENQIINKKI